MCHSSYNNLHVSCFRRKLLIWYLAWRALFWQLRLWSRISLSCSIKAFLLFEDCSLVKFHTQAYTHQDNEREEKASGRKEGGGFHFSTWSHIQQIRFTVLQHNDRVGCSWHTGWSWREATQATTDFCTCRSKDGPKLHTWALTGVAQSHQGQVDNPTPLQHVF